MTGATHLAPGEKPEAPRPAVARAAAATACAPTASRFRGPQRRPDPRARPATPVPARHALVRRRRESTPREVPGRRGRWTAAFAAWRHFAARVPALVTASMPSAPRYLAPALLAAACLAIAIGFGGGRHPGHATTRATAQPAPGAPALVTAVPPREVTAPAAAPAIPPYAAEQRTPPAPSADRLLSEVSTMDLMMPIAEPDLDIRSRHSLWAQVGKTYGIDPLLLYSVALVESKSLYPDGRVAPTPWLFRVDDHLVRGDRQHVQLQMAAASQFGSAVQDVGIMQVYYPMHRDAVRDPLTLLDPRTNITVGAKILRDGMRRTRDRVMGVGYYHSRTPSLARGYGTAVLTVYDRLKAQHRKSARQGPVAR
ncbi:lytic transglycosylase domain-containing protein [Rhodanobacter sp. FDAARGOS 1247]|uniref:lytic transglycosylase domain-containing protein n=1 Tax=Rhodanobacter sp. FDAARGOS 1247 TaxID=2778082 RepID=UPI001EF54168|nr:lytic transglycosylase domain-containing protein [Rhodanobacter sp. FDAARGOS 1247]